MRRLRVASWVRVRGRATRAPARAPSPPDEPPARRPARGRPAPARAAGGRAWPGRVALSLIVVTLALPTAACAQGTPTPTAPGTNAATTGGGPAADALRGAALFAGRVRLHNGGLPCAACHSVAGENPLGGGSMGRDLTTAYDRMGGEAGLRALLGSIAFPTMRQAFADRPLTRSEIDDLVAYLHASAREAAARGTAPRDPGRFGFNWLWLFAILGAGLLNALLLVWWPRQRESLSDRLRRTGRSWRTSHGGGRR